MPTLTPNIGLQIPDFNQPNWQVPTNYDWNLLDLIFGGTVLVPALNVGTLTAGSVTLPPYMNEIVAGAGSTYTMSQMPSLVVGVFVAGALQRKGVDYSITGQVITFTFTTTSTVQALYFYGGTITPPPSPGDVEPLTMGFEIEHGEPGTAVGPLLIAPYAGTMSRCIVATKASDPATDFSFQVMQNGTAIFASSPPTIAHGTAFGATNIFLNLTAVPLSVAKDDLFSLNILTGATAWKVTIQVE